ncbi:hypothetical protein GDO81_008950 [Engystomops pustulosus]|uniref:Uncharacterized protein n=1 Tax=Engystomops pustulosus TaxID=76066 RepID=A0AAV7BNX2_ENGPU|nr:hypothetical protein GDO81_008950 [Engystomops pustulosus]
MSAPFNQISRPPYSARTISFVCILFTHLDNSSRCYVHLNVIPVIGSHDGGEYREGIHQWHHHNAGWGKSLTSACGWRSSLRDGNPVDKIPDESST